MSKELEVYAEYTIDLIHLQNSLMFWNAEIFFAMYKYGHSQSISHRI